jgi:hypothetical protein
MGTPLKALLVAWLSLVASAPAVAEMHGLYGCWGRERYTNDGAGKPKIATSEEYCLHEGGEVSGSYFGAGLAGDDIEFETWSIRGDNMLMLGSQACGFALDEDRLTIKGCRYQGKYDRRK